MVARKRNPDATAAMKALTIYSLLIFSGRRYSLTELAQLLNCAKPTVTRLIAQIETTPGLHVKIDIQKEGKEHYYRAVRPETKPNVSLEAKAIQDLALCRDILTKLLPPQLCQEIAATINQTSVLLDDFDDREAALMPLALAATKGAVDYSTGAMSLYFDGVLVDSIATTLRPFATLDPTQNPGVSIGGYPDNHYGPFTGMIDEVRISDAALSSEQFLNAPPVPEPATATLLCLGAAGLAWRKRGAMAFIPTDSSPTATLREGFPAPEKPLQR